MALKGNLRDFSIIQLLNLVNLARKTGTLYVENGDGKSQITFLEGKLVYAQMAHEDNSLPAVLQRAGKINHSQSRLMQEKAGQMSDKQLGLMIINAGYLQQVDILGSLQDYYLNVVKRFFSWVEGKFYFEPGTLQPQDKIPVRVDLENLIIEGTRLLREWEQLQDEIPSLDMVVRFVERPGANVRNLNLSVEEWRAVRQINNKNTMKQIAQATRLNDMQIRRVIYALLQAGVIEIARPPGFTINFGSAMPNVKKEDQVGLVNRLINRIRAI